MRAGFRKVDANRAIARYSTEAVNELLAGGFDVVVTTKKGQRRCTVDARDGSRVLAATR